MLIAALHQRCELGSLRMEKTTSTQAEVRVKILDTLYNELPRPPFTEEETEQLANEVFDYVFARTTSGIGFDASV